MKTWNVIAALVFAAVSLFADPSATAWPDLPRLAKALDMKEEKPGYFRSESLGVAITVDTNKEEITFLSCPELDRIGTDADYTSKWRQKCSQFFKEALPSWNGADMAFTQIWIALESSQQKQIAIPYNGLVICPNAYFPDCRSLSITKQK